MFLLFLSPFLFVYRKWLDTCTIDGLYRLSIPTLG